MNGHDPSPDRRGSDADAPPEAPRWVKVSGVIAIVLLLLFLAVHLAGGGFRHHMGPRAHTESPVGRP